MAKIWYTSHAAPFASRHVFIPRAFQTAHPSASWAASVLMDSFWKATTVLSLKTVDVCTDLLEPTFL